MMCPLHIQCMTHDSCMVHIDSVARFPAVREHTPAMVRKSNRE